MRFLGAGGEDLMSELNEKLKARQMNQGELSVSPLTSSPKKFNEVTMELVSTYFQLSMYICYFCYAVIIGAKITKKR